jgi:hypothetical protein
MRRDKNTSLLIGLVLLAFVFWATAQECSEPTVQPVFGYITYRNVQPSPLSCWIKTFDPEQPDMGYPYIPFHSNLRAVAVSGTTVSNVPMGTFTRLT